MKLFRRLGSASFFNLTLFSVSPCSFCCGKGREVSSMFAFYLLPVHIATSPQTASLQRLEELMSHSECVSQHFDVVLHECVHACGCSYLE